MRERPGGGTGTAGGGTHGHGQRRDLCVMRPHEKGSYLVGEGERWGRVTRQTTVAGAQRRARFMRPLYMIYYFQVVHCLNNVV